MAATKPVKSKVGVKAGGGSKPKAPKAPKASLASKVSNESKRSARKPPAPQGKLPAREAPASREAPRLLMEDKHPLEQMAMGAPQLLLEDDVMALRASAPRTPLPNARDELAEFIDSVQCKRGGPSLTAPVLEQLHAWDIVVRVLIAVRARV